MQDAARVPQMAVRDDLEPVQGRQAAEHPAPERDQPAVLEHADLAPVLGLVRRRRRLVGVRVGREDGPAATLHHQVRKRQVVPEPRVDLDVVAPAQRVDGAEAARGRVDLRLTRSQPGLEAPVEALLVVTGRIAQVEPAEGVRDIGIGEVADQHPQRIRRPGRVRVGEGDDLGVGLAHGAVLRGHLAATIVDDQPHARRESLDELVRPVGRRIRGDDELELLGGVVEREQVLEPPLDDRLLVVRGDDHADRRLDCVAAHATSPQARERRGSDGVAHMRPEERAHRGPEDDLHRDHVFEPTASS